MIEAHKLYGKLKWADLVQPSIVLANEGFNVTAALAAAIKAEYQNINPSFRYLFHHHLLFILSRTFKKVIIEEGCEIEPNISQL